jgi:hypothetical protein
MGSGVALYFACTILCFGAMITCESGPMYIVFKWHDMRFRAHQPDISKVPLDIFPVQEGDLRIAEYHVRGGISF